ncbi:MAG: DUF222 domain-containing protein [Actinomycetota bacterium]|nr:DUF222 domain-containing protein [Actinomycetota bacterium]
MTSTAHHTESATTADVLAVLRRHTTDRDLAEIAMLQATLEWVKLNQVDADEELANHGFFGDQPIPVTGVGAPLVAEFAAMELAAALGLSTDAGKAYVGLVLELAYRLPRLLAKVEAGRLPVWRAFRVADQTMALPVAGAAHVDQHLAPVADACSWAQLERLVQEAMIRFDPRPPRPDARRPPSPVASTSIWTGSPTTAPCTSTGSWTWPTPRTSRRRSARRPSSSPAWAAPSRWRARSRAAGELARRQLAFDLSGEESPGSGRGVVLFVHLTQDALTGAQSVGRCQNTRSPISVSRSGNGAATPTPT